MAVETYNMGTGRRLTPAESKAKTKDWPKDNGKTLQQMNADAQRAASRYDNFPPGMSDIDEINYNEPPF